MKATTIGAVLCATLLGSVTATADTFYRYRDSKTGRDVFVDRLEQVPLKLRPQAKVVLESGALANHEEAKQAPPPKPADDDGIAEKMMRQLAPATSDGGMALERARNQGGWRNPAGVASTTVDAKLARAGQRPLDPDERAALARFFQIAIYLAVAAVLCAFMVWLALVVCAFRDKHPVWGVLMLFLWPVSYFYLLLHFAKGRLLLKAGAGLALLSPAGVGMWVAWRLYQWFQLVVHARGGRV